MARKKLALSREVLTEIATVDMQLVVGGVPAPETRFSCLTYISCFPTDCT